MLSKEKLIHSLIIFFVSIAAIFAHGYQFAVSDQEIFIPYILKSADPSLFPDDLLFKQLSVGASIFYPLVGFLTKFFDLQVIFFVGYIVFQFIFFLGIFHLAKIILADDKLAYLALLPFFLPKFIGGTATFTYDVFFGYRSVGLIFFIFFLIYILEQKFTKAAISASLGMWFHPLSIIPSFLLLPIFILKFSKNKILEILQSLAIFLVLLITFFLFSKSDFFGQLPYFFDQGWLTIIKYRDDYLFPSTWEIRGWLALFLYPALIIFCLKYLKTAKKKIILVVIICFSVFLINYLFLEIAKIPIIAQFQLVRAIAPMVYLGLVMSPLLLISKNCLIKVIGAIAFIAISLNLFSLQFEDYKNFNLKIQFPKQTNDWIDVQKWAIQNTDPKDKFLVPPYQTGFRIFSHRSIVSDIKDGAVSMYTPVYAFKWQGRMKDLKNYKYLSRYDLLNLTGKYQFNYVVTQGDKMLDLDIVYKNKSFIIYKI